MANARDDNDQISRPLVLDRTPRTPEELIAMGAEKMSDYLDPESGVRTTRWLSSCWSSSIIPRQSKLWIERWLVELAGAM